MKLFKRSKILERKIDDFLDLVCNSSLHFKEGIKFYLFHRKEEFEEQFQLVKTLENQADNLRREIETDLYTHTLIPESRGDVLGILENIDNVINRTKSTLLEFSVEQPTIPPEFNQSYLELAEYSVQAAQSVVSAARAFFREIHAVRDFINKVLFYEKEADKASERLKRKAFQSDLELAMKFHLRYFALHIDSLADCAESVADRLAICTIKRTI